MEENRTEPEIRLEGATKVQHSAPSQGAAIPSPVASPVRLPGDATGSHANDPCAVCGNSGWLVCQYCPGTGINAETGRVCSCSGNGLVACPACNPDDAQTKQEPGIERPGKPVLTIAPCDNGESAPAGRCAP